jgi:B12-binding domain/radical SAM domain protein
MPEPDLVLLHAPSVYDFRQEAILYGPIADFAPAPLAFEILPLGFASLAEYLEQAGYNVCILNLARHMLDDAQFDAEQAIADLNPTAFAIDFHWLSHAQGALAVAQIVRAVHPETPVILGGFAATYYHRELIDYPQVDYVVCGDSTEEPLLQLIECLSLGRVPDQVPGLTWRTGSGYVTENLPGPLPTLLNDLAFRGNNSSLNHHSSAPAQEECYPAAVAVMARGCIQNCLTCGGSAYAYQQVHGRQTPAYHSPESLARDLQSVRGYDNSSVYVPCDITQPGMDYAYRFLQAMRGFPKLIHLDLLQPTPRKFLRDMTNALPHLALQVSMGSHDPQVRQATGKNYSNPAIEKTIEDALSLGCECLNLRFTIGLPRQDYDSVMSTVAYCDELLTRFDSAGRLQPSIAPLAPFLDPGSIAFEEPEPNGYRLLLHSLEEHRRALLAPTWRYVLNYETEWMAGDDIVRATYDAAVALAQLRAKHGLIPDESAKAIEALVNQTRRLMAEIEYVLALDDTERLQDTLRALKSEIDAVNYAGLWNSKLGLAASKYDGQPTDQRYVGTTVSSQGVWGSLRSWWNRRQALSSHTAEAPPTRLPCTWFRPPPI